MSQKMYNKEKACQEGASFLKGYERKKKLRRILLLLIFILGLGGLTFGLYLNYKRMYRKIPEKIQFIKGKEQKLIWDVPLTGEVVNVSMQQNSNVPHNTETVNLQHEVVLHIDDENQYALQLKLFGVIPFKEVRMNLVDEMELIPVGYPVGMYLNVKGVLVAGVGDFTDKEGKRQAPVKDILEKGDYLLQIDGKDVEGKKEFQEIIENSNGRELTILLERKGEKKKVKVTPMKNQEGIYKLGIWIRDDTQGIGTMTYLKSDGEYGALGHGISDMDTLGIMDLEEGSLYETSIISMEKSIPGTPGQISGLIVYKEGNILGTLESNSTKGVFGHCNSRGIEYVMEHIEDSPLGDTPMPVGLKQDIVIGKAEILATIQEEPELYEINITAIHPDGNQKNRNIEFRVTDEKLLKLTGGIVQGMSGSPIIQDGKIIGAVTHVLVNDPTRGYGIFIENMLEH